MTALEPQKTRTYPSLEIASFLTGIALCQTNFSKLMEIAEFLSGEPIWTHELACEDIIRPIQDEGYRQFPLMPSREDAAKDYKAAIYKVVEAYGTAIEVTQGYVERKADPLTTAMAAFSKET